MSFIIFFYIKKKKLGRGIFSLFNTKKTVIWIKFRSRPVLEFFFFIRLY